MSFIYIPEGYPNNYGSLIFEFQDLRLELTRDRLKELPRKKVSGLGANVSYSFAGNSLIQRNYGETKYMWDINYLCDRKEYLTIKALLEEHDKYIDKNFAAPITEYPIVLHDLTETLVDRGVNSRALAEGFTTPISISEDNNIVEYFAKFYCVCDTTTFQCPREGQWWRVQFSLQETIKYLP